MNEYKEKMSATKVNNAANAALMEDKTDSLQKSVSFKSLWLAGYDSELFGMYARNS